MILLISFLLPPFKSQNAYASDWYNAGWSYRVKITVDNTKVSGSSDLTSFPIMVDLSDLPASFFSTVKTDGSDIVITASDGTTKLSRDLESLSTVDLTGILWFEAATLSATIDTDFYIYYGNASATESDDTGTWTNYIGVWHLNEDPGDIAPQMQDSSSSGEHATATGSMTLGTNSISGIAGSALTFDGVDDQIITGSISGTLANFSYWAKYPLTINSSSACQVGIGIYDSLNARYAAHGSCSTLISSEVITLIDGNARRTYTKSGSYSNSDWHYFVFNKVGSSYYIYADGSLISTFSASSGARIFSSPIMLFGRYANTGSIYDPMSVDEVRYRSSAVTTDWIATEYENIQSPGTFYTIETPEVIPTPTITGITAAQRTDGVDTVLLSFIVDSPSDADTLQAKIEYSINGGISWSDPTLSSNSDDTVATYGDPDVDNAQTYQIGQSSAYITSSSGANTISTVWLAGTDLPSSTNISNALIRIAITDGAETSDPAESSEFILDFLSPTIPTSPTSSRNETDLTVNWSSSVESNFDQYEIWYGTNESDVNNRTGSAILWDTTDDPTLTTRTTTTTTITGTDSATSYFYYFCAIDDFMNESCVSGTVEPSVSMTAGETRDADGNGNIDRIVLTLSKDVVSGTVIGGDFTVDGYIISSASRTANSQITLVLEESDAPDTNVTPTVTLVGSLTDSSGNIASSGERTTTDGAHPTILTLTLHDTGTADGLIDSVTILWSENVDTDTGDTPVGADFGTITLPDGSTANLESATISDPAGLSETVTISGITGQVNLHTGTGSAGINGITSAWSDGVNVTSNPDDVELIIDEASPLLLQTVTTAPRYEDADADGRIDRVKLQWSEPVTITYIDSNWTTVSHDLTDFDVSGIESGNNTDTVYLTSSAAISLTGVDSGTQPTLSFTAGSGGSITDTTGNALASFSEGSLYDAAPARLIVSGADAPVYRDNNENGTLDRVVLTFTEAVDVLYADADWTATANDITNFDVGSVLSGTGTATITLSISGSVTSNVTGVGSGTQPTLAFTAGAGNITDASSNTTPSFGPVSLNDDASPVRIAQGYRDMDANGEIDRIDISFSEPIVINECEIEDFPLNDIEATGISLVSSSCTISGSDLQIDSIGAPENTTAISLELAYVSENGTGDSLQDASGNPVNDLSSLPLSDNANLLPRAQTYQDANADGVVDQAVITFTENISNDECENEDYTFGGTHATGVSVSACTVSGADLILSLTGTPNASTLLSLTIAYTQSAGTPNSLHDATNNNVADFSARTLTDLAAPRLRTDGTFAPTYLDNDGDAEIDRIQLTFTENVTFSYTDSEWTITENDFPDFDITSYISGSGTSVLVLGATASPETTGVSGGTEPTLEFTSSAETLTDGTNALTSISSTPFIDGAIPTYRLGNGNDPQYEDSDGDAEIDRVKFVFTESVTITYVDTDWTATAHNLTDFDVTGIASGNASSTIYLAATAAANITGVGEGTQPTLAFTGTDGSLADAANNTLPLFFDIDLVDAASPLLIEVTPEDGATAVPLADDIVAVFSEPIVPETATYTFSSSPSNLIDTWTVSNTILTIEHAGDWTPGEEVIFTITSASDVSENTFAGSITGITHPTTFTLQGIPLEFTSITTEDQDGNGQIDRLIALMSDDVSAGTVAGSDFTVDGYVVSSASRTGNGEITIVLTESGVPDTDAIPDVTLTGSLTGTSGGVMTTGTISATDGARPVALSGAYKDVLVVNGTIDRVDIVFSEPMTGCEYTDWSFTGTDSAGISVTACTISNDEVRLTLSGAPSLDTNLTLTAQYTSEQGTADSLEDALGNAAESFSLVNITDLAAPRLRTDGTFAPTYLDNDGDAEIDRIQLTFTENVTFSYTDSEWTITENDFPDFDITSYISGSGTSVLVLGATASPETTGVSGGTEPTLEFTSSAETLTDGTNALTSISSTPFIDGAIPHIISQSYHDIQNVDGRIDRVDLIFTETPSIISCESSDFTFGDADAGEMYVSACTINGTNLQLTISDAPIYDTRLALTLDYTQSSGGADSIRDGSGNILATFSSFVLSDAAVPFLRIDSGQTPSYTDSTGDGNIDSVSLTFTEEVNIIYVDDAWDTTPYELTEFDITGIHTNSASTIILSATAASGITGVGLGTQPSFAFNAALGGSLVDLSGNTLSQIDTTSLIDVANPVVISGEYQDITGNGQIDSFNLLLSESMSFAECEQVDYTINGLTDSYVSSCSVSGNTLSLSLTNAATNVTGGEITLTYNALSGAEASLTDISGNPLASFEDAFILEDAALPILVSVSPAEGEISDLSTPIVLEFSEAMNEENVDIDWASSYTEAFSSSWNETSTILTVTHDIFTVSPIQLTLSVAKDSAGNDLLVEDSLILPLIYTFGNTPAPEPSVDSPGNAGYRGSIRFWITNLENQIISSLSENDHVILHWEQIGPQLSVRLNISSDDYSESFTSTMRQESIPFIVPHIQGSEITFLLEKSSEYSFLTREFSYEYHNQTIENDPHPLQNTLVRCPNYPSVYSITSDGKRRPFINEQTFFTWGKFNEVSKMSCEFIFSLPMGPMMLPKSNVVLIKIESIPKVFTLTDTNHIRWIPSEEIARNLYGNNWADYVIDVPPTMWPQFIEGIPMQIDETVHLDTLRRRVDLR